MCTLSRIRRKMRCDEFSIKLTMPTDMKHAHRYSNDKEHRLPTVLSAAKERVSRASGEKTLSGDCLTTGKFGNANKYTDTFGHP